MKNEQEICNLKNYQKQPEFEILDLCIDFRYRQDLYQLILSMGYSCVSEYVHDSYYNKEFSVSKTAMEIKRSKTDISYWMSLWGFKKRPQGGNVRNKNLSDPKFVEKIKNARGSISCQEAQKKFNCSYGSIHKIWMQAA